jgi:hypothetical protein
MESTMASRFHNISTSELADRIGRADADIKARTEQLDELKTEFKRRQVNIARGNDFVVSASESATKRLDTTRLKADLGDALEGYYNESTSTRILIKPAPKVLEEAA